MNNKTINTNKINKNEMLTNGDEKSTLPLFRIEITEE